MNFPVSCRVGNNSWLFVYFVRPREKNDVSPERLARNDEPGLVDPMHGSIGHAILGFWESVKGDFRSD